MFHLQVWYNRTMHVCHSLLCMCVFLLKFTTLCHDAMADADSDTVLQKCKYLCQKLSSKTDKNMQQ